MMQGVSGSVAGAKVIHNNNNYVGLTSQNLLSRNPLLVKGLLGPFLLAAYA